MLSMLLRFLMATAFLLMGFTAAMPAPARYSTRIRSNWDKKGIIYSGQKKATGEASQAQRAVVPLPQALISAPFRQSLGQGAWGRTWGQDSQVRIGDGHSRGADSMQGTSIVGTARHDERQHKKARLVDWQSDHSFSSSSSPDSDSSWSISSIESQSPSTASSDESSGEVSSVEPSQDASAEKQVSETGSSSSVTKQVSAPGDRQSQANSSTTKKFRVFKQEKLDSKRNKVTFKQAWTAPTFTFKLSPSELAQRVRTAKIDGLTENAFRRMAGIHVQSAAPPDYAAQYKYEANLLRLNEDRSRKTPHLPPIQIPLNQPLMKPKPEVPNWRQRNDEALNVKVEETVRRHLKAKKIDYEKATLLKLEEATRDIGSKGFDCTQRKLRWRINELIRDWKKPNVVEWHQFAQNRKRHRDGMATSARKRQ